MDGYRPDCVLIAVVVGEIGAVTSCFMLERTVKHSQQWPSVLAKPKKNHHANTFLETIGV